MPITITLTYQYNIGFHSDYVYYLLTIFSSHVQITFLTLICHLANFIILYIIINFWVLKYLNYKFIVYFVFAMTKHFYIFLYSTKICTFANYDIYLFLISLQSLFSVTYYSHFAELCFNFLNLLAWLINFTHFLCTKMFAHFSSYFTLLG